MADGPARYRRLGLWLVSLGVIGLGTAAVLAYFHGTPPGTSPAAPVPSAEAEAAARTYTPAFQIQYFCSRCHAYPRADTLPRCAWKKEVELAFQFFAESHLPMQAPALDEVVKYYEQHAPLELPLPVLDRAPGPLPVRFEQTAYPAPSQVAAPAIANVNLVHLFDERRLDVLACDMRAGLVMALSPYTSSPAWQVLGTVSHPAHAEVVDLDGDGIKDILVANLGSATQTDNRVGSVIWLRGSADGRFTPIPLLEGVGRVADVQAADFRGVGKLDLVVAVFGWRRTGEVLYLENQTTDWSHPRFVPHVLDDRHGAIHVPVGDINGDGRPDIVALISQEHETVVGFVNEGNGRFRKETLYTGPHPAYGSTGIQLADLNGDGKLDVLYTNGDSRDEPHILKPYHGIQWLENQGSFPFVHHPIAPLCGVHRAVAADFRGCGKLDIVAVSCLPERAYPQRKQLDLDAVIYLEQTEPGHFVRHSLETSTCDHLTCAAGDIFATGKVDLVTGSCLSAPGNHAVTLWKNPQPSR
jgi:hypothetical protein